MDNLTIFARFEPTDDSIVLKYNPKSKKKDLVFYKDRECKDFYARVPWHYIPHNMKQRKYFTLNCYRYKLEIVA